MEVEDGLTLYWWQRLITFGSSRIRVKLLHFFQKPSITSIHPSSGPEAGGTYITISGKDLAIGNLGWKVQFGSGVCDLDKVVKGVGRYVTL